MMIYLIFLLFGTAISQDFSCPSGYIGSNSNALNSGANDVIVVTQVDGSFKSTHISVQVGKFHNFWSPVWPREGTEMKISRLSRHIGYTLRGLLLGRGWAYWAGCGTFW